MFEIQLSFHWSTSPSIHMRWAFRITFLFLLSKSNHWQEIVKYISILKGGILFDTPIKLIHSDHELNHNKAEAKTKGDHQKIFEFFVEQNYWCGTPDKEIRILFFITPIRIFTTACIFLTVFILFVFVFLFSCVPIMMASSIIGFSPYSWIALC